MDVYHGVEVTDPYRYMEDLENPAVVDWMRAQSEYARSTLDSISGRQGLIDKMHEFDGRMSDQIHSLQITDTDRHFYQKRTPDDEVAKLYIREGYEGEEALLFDPSTYRAEEGLSFSVTGFSATRDGTKVALAVAPNGSESAYVLILDVERGELYPEEIDRGWGPPSWLSEAGGRYTVSRLLGEGGKKKVYLAHDATLDRDVAFAVIKTEGLDEIGRERVRREAQAMGRMGTHPCIMSIYDLGEEDGQPYMVQPLMGGGDVEGLIEDADGPLPLEQALRIASQTAQGLVFAHSKGIIHRDLKPGNVWLDDDGAAKIGDFGLAIATDRSRLTVEKLMVGTVNYMPPEQATGGEVTPKASCLGVRGRVER